MIYRAGRIRENLVARRKYRQGAKGERYAADCLDRLREFRMYAFHDVPAQGAKCAFNLDHVVIGASGVFVVETKTYTKDRKDAEGADQKAVFDGKFLTMPGGRKDEAALKQAQANADWLAKELERRLGLKLTIQPLVTPPGWWMVRTGSGPVWVMNPKELVKHLSGKAVLDEKTVDQVRRQLDQMCRTVMFEG